MVYVHLPPVVSVIVCMPLQPMEEWVVFLIMGSVLAGYMFRYQFCVVGGLDAIVCGSIRWSPRFDLAALCGRRTLNVCYVVLRYCVLLSRKNS